jgi:hypothetical protein
MKWFRQLMVGLSLQRPRFMPGSIHVGSVLDKVAPGQVFVSVLWFAPANIPPWIHTHISPGGINNMPAGGGSSQTFSHPIEMNNNITAFLARTESITK